MMFSVFCPTHDARVLMTRRNAVDFWNGPDGAVIRWKCNCGHEGFLDHTGSRADAIEPEQRKPTELDVATPSQRAATHSTAVT